MFRKGIQGLYGIVKLSPDGQTLASCGDDGAIDLWGFESGEKLHTLAPGPALRAA